MNRTYSTYLSIPNDGFDQDFDDISEKSDFFNITWSRDVFGPKRTNYDIMVERRAVLAKALQNVEDTLKYYETGTCNITCTNCGAFFPKEIDFWKHYLISDETYANLGNCPNPKKTD